MTLTTSGITAASNRFLSVHGRAPVIGVDLDGTTADMVAGLRTRMADAFGITATASLSRFPQPDDYAMWLGANAWFQDKADFLDHFLAAERAGFYRELPIYPGAAVTLNSLVDAGMTLKAVTARSGVFNHDSGWWISANRLPLPTIVNSGFVKEAVPDIDVFLDDAPSVVTGLLDAGRRVVIFDQNYNRAVPEDTNGIRVSGWGTPMLNAIEVLLSTASEDAR